MAKRREDRYQDVAGLLEDLEKLRVDLRIGGGEWDRGKTTLFEAIRSEKEKTIQLEEEIESLRWKLRASLIGLGAAAVTIVGILLITLARGG